MSTAETIVAVERLVKQPSESVLLAIDFTNWLAAGETLASVYAVSAIPSGLTIESAAVASDTVSVQFRVGHIEVGGNVTGGGKHGVNYRIQASATTSAGNRLVGDAILEVRDY